MITANTLGLTIGKNVILEDVSFVIKTGEFVGLIGPNGAGKTSLIKTILGVYKPTSGSLTVSSNAKIGYVPQSYALSNVVPISVAEVLAMSGVSAKDLLIAVLNKVGLPAEFLKRNFHKLSGGQKQRVIIARVLCQNPTVIIFDEPLNGVDFETKIKIYKLLDTLNKKDNVTILFVSHEVDHIIDKCSYILCLNRTMHTGCHPLDFAKGILQDCPVLTPDSITIPVHHHHTTNNTQCSC